jgi:hypothetical protein
MIFMAPASMSSEEASIFLDAKGTMPHISPLNQKAFGWLELGGYMSLVWLAHRHLTNANERASLMIHFTLFGTFFGLLLSFAAVLSGSVRLAQFQPMRIFMWVTLLIFILLVTNTMDALRKSLPIGVVLLGALMLSVLNSTWSIAFVLIGGGYFLIVELKTILQIQGLQHLNPRIQRIGSRLAHYHVFQKETFLKSSSILVIACMFVAWILGDRQPFESFRDPVPLVAALILIPLLSRRVLTGRWRWLLISVLIAYSLVGASIYRHRYYAQRLDPDWDSIRYWVRENTEKDAQFITAGHGWPGNFRTLSFRTTLNESQSALAWVDPHTYLQNGNRAQKVNESYDGNNWDLEYLFALAEEWKAEYILVKGHYEPNISSIYCSGHYSVFETQVIIAEVGYSDQSMSVEP